MYILVGSILALGYFVGRYVKTDDGDEVVLVNTDILIAVLLFFFGPAILLVLCMSALVLAVAVGVGWCVLQLYNASENIEIHIKRNK